MSNNDRFSGIKKNLSYLGRGIKKLSSQAMFIVLILFFVAVFILIRFERNGYIPALWVMIGLLILLVLVSIFYLWCKKNRDD